jgi:cobalt-precorrin 5A hydrolase/precorrin-3B C17-methyltransferase
VSAAPVLVALTQGGCALARRLAEQLPGAEVHGLVGRTQGADASFEGTAAHLRELFGARRPIVGVCAAGVLVRALAPLLADKGAEPPVLALAEDGSAVVPLLGGHRGANDLARRIAAALGIEAAITTAGDAWPTREITRPSWRRCSTARACASKAPHSGSKRVTCRSPRTAN